MNKIVILESKFEKECKSGSRPDIGYILNHPMKYYVEKACVEAGYQVVNSKEDLDDDEILVLNSCVPGISEEEIHSITDSEEILLYNHEGILIAFFSNKKELEEIDFDMSFDDFANLHSYPADAFEAWDEEEDLPFEVEDKYEMSDEFEDFEDFDDIDDDEYFYVDSVYDFETLRWALDNKVDDICVFWMNKGIRIDNPDTTYIDPEVEIGEGTWIEGNVHIEGKTVIGKGCLITSNSTIQNCTIGDNVTVTSSYLQSSVMEDRSNIGPFGRLRPNAHIGKGVHIGNFVEVKNSTLGEGTKAGHLSYVGDADVGAGVNIGCGVVFVNYDGKNKHRSVVEDGAFIGSNANVVAPVHVEKDGYIAAGSTITKDVKEGALAIERARQIELEGYVQKKRDCGKL